MSLMTFDVPGIVGRVCYVTEEDGGFHVTVECPGIRTALGLRVRGRKAPSGWVRVAGRVRIDPGLKKSGEPREGNLAYFHHPHDGSEKSHWWFFQMSEGELEPVADPAVSSRIARAASRLNAHLDRWDATLNPADLSETLLAIAAAGAELEKALKARLEAARDMEAKVDSVDVSI